jgi:site-specific recombinase XerC
MPAAKKVTDEDRARVQLMAAAGMTQPTIAARMGMTDKTLREHFRVELDFGLAEINTLAVGQLVRQIKVGNMAAICFWLKCRAGFQETSAHRFVAKDGEDRKMDMEAVRAFMQSDDRSG